MDPNQCPRNSILIKLAHSNNTKSETRVISAEMVNELERPEPPLNQEVHQVDYILSEMSHAQDHRHGEGKTTRRMSIPESSTTCTEIPEAVEITEGRGNSLNTSKKRKNTPATMTTAHLTKTISRWSQIDPLHHAANVPFPALGADNHANHQSARFVSKSMQRTCDTL